MPKDGDTIKAYCKKCERETIWVSIQRILFSAWKCLGCGTER